MIWLRKKRYGFRPMNGTKELVPAMTTSFSNEPKIYGREQDIDRVRSFLFEERSQGLNIPIISIIGIGGLGKTALARLVFNDEKVRSCFHVRIWVCVSDPFDEFRVAKDILQSVKKGRENLVTLQNVLEEIDQSIKGKKFFLVLDDVWTDDFENWEQLMGSFKSASQESRILVTTRKERTAEMINTTEKVFLGKLSKKECWSLFSQIAFSRMTVEDKRFEKTGRIIVNKCDGLPLAVKSLGSLLRLKTEIKQWQNVLEDEIWNLEDIKEQVFRSLLLSYFDLPSKLKKCFSYCVIFPKDYKINIDELIRLWMAQGYLKVDDRKDMELIGEEYFQNLAMRSFFQDFERSKDDDSIKSCKMHDIVHDVAQFLTKNEFSCIGNNGVVNSQSKFSYENAQHLMIYGESIPNSIYNGKKVHSLIVDSFVIVMKEIDLSKLFDQLTCLRTLSLNGCLSTEKILKEIKNLIHLRYLNLSYSLELNELTETLCELYNLETLNIRGCQLQHLPQGIGKLINLKYLINSGNHILLYMPKGMERLTGLHTLSKFVVSGGHHGKEKACTLEPNFSRLQGSLELRGLGNVANVSEVVKAELKSKENLIGLCLNFESLKFDMEEEERRGEYHKAVLETLEAPPNLKKLNIEEYRGKTIFPSWMILLTKLRKLTLYLCYTCELPPLGKLSSLESLKLQCMLTVESVGNEFLGIENDTTSSSPPIIAFPNLKKLVIKDMPDCEEWNYEIRSEDITIMPCLRSLSISLCNELKALPDHLLQSTTLKELKIAYCPILNPDKLRVFSYGGNTIFPNLTNLTLQGDENRCLPLGKLPSLESLHICHWESVKRVDNEFLGIETSGTYVIAFPKLKTLEFSYMEEWEEWEMTKGVEDIEIMPCLHSLSILACKKLQALPDYILQKPTLQTLKIMDCSILVEGYNKETGTDEPKISRIPITYIW